MQYLVPVSERIPLLQFVPSGEQNHPLAIQLIPLVTLWPLLAQVQHTVSPSTMSSLLGTNTSPCPTVTSHTRGPGWPQGVRRGRGVGVGLAVTSGESTNARLLTTAAMNTNRRTRRDRGIQQDVKNTAGRQSGATKISVKNYMSDKIAGRPTRAKKLSSRLKPYHHRPRAELQAAHELQVDWLR